MQAQRFSFAPWLPYAALVAACFVAYANVYGGAFLFDDVLLISRNNFLLHWSGIADIFTSSTTAGAGDASRFYRPLQLLLYLIIYQAFGFSTAAYHLLNVVLHAANICLGYRLGLRLGFPRRAVFAAMLLWGLHPIHTEAVTYISGTPDLLAAGFCLLGLLALCGENPRRTLIACLCFVLALLGKETAIVFPLLAMSLVFLKSEKRWSPRSYLATWPFWAIAWFYLVLKYLALASGQGMFHPASAAYDNSLPHRFYTCLAALATYGGLLLAPRHLHMQWDFPVYLDFRIPAVEAGFALCLAMAGALFYKPSRPATPAAWGVLWFLCAFLPCSGVIIPINASFYEHWMYMPTLGLSLGLCAALDGALGKYNPVFRRCAACCVALAAGMLGAATFVQNTVWQNPVTFYENIFSTGARAPESHNNLGTYYYDIGDMDKAIQQFRIAIDVSTHYAVPHYNMAISLLRKDPSPANIDLALQNLDASIEIDPDYLPPYAVLADIYAARGNREKAEYYRSRSEGQR